MNSTNNYTAVTDTDHGELFEIYDTDLFQEPNTTVPIGRFVIFSGSGNDHVLTPDEARELARHLTLAAEGAERA